MIGVLSIFRVGLLRKTGLDLTFSRFPRAIHFPGPAATAGNDLGNRININQKLSSCVSKDGQISERVFGLAFGSETLGRQSILGDPFPTKGSLCWGLKHRAPSPPVRTPTSGRSRPLWAAAPRRWAGLLKVRCWARDL